MSRARIVAAFVVTALAAMGTAGCATEAGPGGPSDAGPTIALVDDTPAPTASATPEVTGPAAVLGESFSYAAGLRVRIGRPERFRPSPWVERQPGVPLALSVVVLNRTGEEWNPSQLHVRLQSGFRPATQIYDAEQGIVARPEQRLPDGETVRFRVAYWVLDQDRLSVEFAPGFGYQVTVVDG